ncbi:hypothetical protein TARUN_7956 [Trichoderma arundinaceum]|uniref:Uncharacterized protein n=1 Tax=Trichoderma arundinaceum TaxID=490622 RepID=A0A395NEE1_TRIAR|nr:hypothetical protein TARUN_7956 [Trichoderma arundinaceum]
MDKKPLQNYAGEIHDIYLGKNRRLADPMFFPAPGVLAPLLWDAERKCAMEVDDLPDGPLSVIKSVNSAWGWGCVTRLPPGGPAPLLKDYEKAMEAMTSEVYQTWDKIQNIIRTHEDAIQSWVFEFQPGTDSEEGRNNSRLWAILKNSWHRTVASFNECHPDIRMFMEAKSVESDFQISVPDFNSPRRFPFTFLNQYFLNGDVLPKHGALDRDHYVVIYRHPFNFTDVRDLDNWPFEEEPPRLYASTYVCNGANSREFFRNTRAPFLVPQIASYELLNPVRLLSFLHYRGRYHPSVFVKMDNDMTFVGRRTNHLTGPMIANRMVSLTDSSSGSAKGYHAKLWRGWGSKPDAKVPAAADEYDDLWHRGQLFGTSEAWILLQSQRATYLYIWHVLTSICGEMKLDPTALVPSRPVQERNQIFTKARKTVEALQRRHLGQWIAFTRQLPFLPPPTQISSRYYGELEFKMEVSEQHIQELFSDPGYFFDCIHELKEHHWGNIGMKNDAKNPDSSDQYTVYMEQYTNEQTRHILYFDLIRGVLRRSIFEFYMWNCIRSRLQEFEDMIIANFADYGRKDTSDTDGTNLLKQPPLLLSGKTRREHSKIAEAYLSLVILIRYHAVFFVNEFRKKGIHAGSSTMRDLTYSIGRVQEDTQDRICNIQKKHYGAPDLNHHSKIQQPWFKLNKVADDDHFRLFAFEAMDSFIANAMDCTNCGIKEAAGFLQEFTQSSDTERLEKIFTVLLDNTIDGLDLLSTLADHLESLWSAMDRIGGAVADETLRRKYFDLGSKDISINFIDFDAFDFDEKIPMKRLKRLFLFFDELQGFKSETVSVGHARGDLKRFGASLLCKLITPLNNKSGGHKANQEAITRLEKAMGVSANDYPYEEKESPMNLDQEEAKLGATVPLVSQPRSYRNIAAHERSLAKERQERRDALIEELVAPSKADMAREKKRLKKLARRRDKAKQRSTVPGKPIDEDEDEDEDMPDAGHENVDTQSDSRWEESLHSTLKQFQLPPVPETRTLPEPQVAAPPFTASLQPASKAPDGRPKNAMKKREWATLEAIYGIHGSANAAVSYAQMRSAMNALGYEEVGRGGSHMNYVRQDGRWPHNALPRGENIQVARTHGRERAAAAKGKSRDWGRRLCERGLTFDFIKQWYVKG